MFKDAVSDEGFVYYGLSLDFDTKGRGFYFNSGEKKSFEMAIFWRGKPMCIVSVRNHASTYAL